ASDDVAVASAELFANGASQGVSTAGAADGLYRVFTWSVPLAGALANTSLSLTANATDTSGNVGQRAITVQVVPDLPPKISLQAPAPNQAVREGDDLVITYLLDDDEGVVAAAPLSGGLIQGKLKPGPLLPLGVPQSVTIRAPLPSRGQPPTVGILAQDTAGQQTREEVPVSVTLDTEAPTATLSLPVAPSQGRLTIKQDGSLGARADVGDNVRVTRVEVLLDGAEMADADPDHPLLPELSSTHVETRVPNPNAPGQILLDRRYSGSFGGTVSFKDVPPGAHKLALVAYDGPGNSATTASIDFDIIAFVDKEPPVLTLKLVGTPDAATAVAGSTIKVQLVASDDGLVDTLGLSLDGVPLTVPTSSPAQTMTASIPVQLPPLGADGPRTISFTGTAIDTTGKETQASLAVQLVADEPPTVSVTDPPGGSTLIEEQWRSFSIQSQDDTGVVRETLALSTAAVAPTGTEAVQLSAALIAGGQGAPSATLTFGDGGVFALSTIPGALIATPPAASTIGGHRSNVRLTLGNGPAGLGVRGQLSSHFRVLPGHENDAATLAFLAQNQGGKRAVSFDPPQMSADLSWPAGSIDVDEVWVELSPVSGGEPLSITGVGLHYDADGTVELRAQAGGERLSLERIELLPQAATPVVTSERMRLPLGQAPRNTTFTAIALDEAGQTGVGTLPLYTV
ncbi:MAG: hypothetical protein JST92_26430, partial [Deltaproteobacteria bacterium]|nr:hypothetical protein [Deltaproteobacteria bacterium]